MIRITNRASYWIAVGAFSCGLALLLECTVTIEWSFPNCSSSWDGAAPAVFGAPLPYQRWAGASLEYTFVPHLYALNVLLIFGLTLFVVHGSTARLAKRWPRRTSLALFIPGMVLCIGLLGLEISALGGLWHPVASIETLPGESLRDLRPLRVTTGRHYDCRPSWLSAFWFAPKASTPAASEKSTHEATPARLAAREPSAELASAEAPQQTRQFRVAGRLLEILQTEEIGEVRLDGKTLSHGTIDNDAAPFRSLIRNFGAVAPFDNVVLLRWEGRGNACNGYGFTFLGINEGGSFKQVDVPFCGGAEPLITASPTQVTLEIPDAPPNRGSGIVPGETWVYRHGAVSKLPRQGLRTVEKNLHDGAP
jgi:hypothetical protein